MSLGDSFRLVASLIEELEAAGISVEDAARAGEVDDGVRVDLTVTVPEGVALASVASADGELEPDDDLPVGEGGPEERAAASTPRPSARADAEQNGGTGEVHSEDDPTDDTGGNTTSHVCPAENCDRAFGTEHGMKIHYGRMHDGDDAGGDADGTGEVDSGESEELSGDATEGTDSNGTADAEETAVEGFDPERIRDAVEDADTLREAALALDLDREEATALLRELDLLELVHGRVATKRERDELKREIDSRIRESAASSD